MQQLPGGPERVRSPARARKGEREREARLVQIGVQRERALERSNRVGGTTAVREHETEVGDDDGVVGFDALGITKRGRGRAELLLRTLARRQAEMGVG